jgi:fatty acid desaturase
MVGLVLLAGNWSGIARSPATIVASVLFAFVGCIIAHNHMHVPVFHGRKWNSIFQLFLMFGFGQPPTGIITAHNERHHRHLDSDQDFVRTSLARFRWNFLNLIAFPFLSIATMYREKPGDLCLWKRTRPHLYLQAVLERAVFYSALIALLAVDWQATALYLILPWILAQLALVGINLLQHQDCDINSEFDHSRNVTGLLTNWLLLNNGYHTAHHLRPSLHWSVLPDFHRRHVKPHIDPALDHPSFTSLILERIRRNTPTHAR